MAKRTTVKACPLKNRGPEFLEAEPAEGRPCPQRGDGCHSHEPVGARQLLDALVQARGDALPSPVSVEVALVDLVAVEVDPPDDFDLPLDADTMDLFEG